MSVIALKGEFNGLRYGLPTFRRLIPFTVKTQRGANDTIQGDKGYLRPTYGSKGESLVGIELYSSTYTSHSLHSLALFHRFLCDGCDFELCSTFYKSTPSGSNREPMNLVGFKKTH
jgi:hypothetical protein